MSRLRQTKITTPANPPTNTEELHYNNAGPGFNSPVALCAVDESGNIAMLAHFAILDYRFIKKQIFTATGNNTYTPTNGTRLAYIQLVGGGGASQNTNSASSNNSVSGAGGGGGYADGFVTNPVSVTIAVGAGGVAGANPGADTTYNSTTIVAKGGTNGAGPSTAGTTGTSAGGAGGVSGTAGTNGVTFPGGKGGSSIGMTATQAIAGYGGDTALAGIMTGGVIVTAAAVAATAGNLYGGGASGAVSGTGVANGAAGGNGIAIVWEFA